MKKISKTVASAAFILLVSSSLTYSQLKYTAANSSNNAGTYTDLGTNGTVITTANFNDANSAPVNIGFSFDYGCDGPFTQFILNTNGFIKMGSVPPSAANLFFNPSQSKTGGVMNSTNPADVNIISAFNVDLAGATGAEYRVYTQGTAPSRITTIQFKNLVDASSGTPLAQYNSIAFQIKLYEGSNEIEFVYGNWTPSANAPAYKTAAVGLKADTVEVTVKKAEGAAWSMAAFQNGNYTPTGAAGDAHNHKNNFLPDFGRTYKFTPVVSYDIAVTDIYTLGSLPLNIAPQPIVSAILENLSPCGDITLDVTLSVSGAQTYTDVKSVTIPAGSSTIVNFTNYNPTVEGIDTIIVSVPADINNVNNARSYRQEVTKNNMNYADNSIPNGNVGLQFTGLILTRYIIKESRKVNAVDVFISNDVNTIGKTMYAVVVDESGTIIGSSSNWTAGVGDLGKYHSFPINNPPTINSNVNFLVGLAQPEPGYNPVATQIRAVNGQPNGRPETFFVYQGLSGGAFAEAPVSGIWMMGITFSLPVGINEPTDLSKGFSVYPNPGHGLINFQIGKDYTSTIEITVLDIYGKRCYNETISNTSKVLEKNIDISHLSEGVYFIQVESEGQGYTEKFILTK